MCVVEPTKIPMANENKEVESAWGIFSGSDIYHALSDATLFSSSLPVLPHEKCKYQLLFKDYLLY